MIGCVPLPVAAKILGMSVFSLQCGLRTKQLPVGTCWKNEDSTCFKYVISPTALSKFQGISLEDIEKQVEIFKKERAGDLCITGNVVAAELT